MAKTRFQALHNQDRVSVAGEIAKLALQNGGILYLNQWEIAKAIGEDHQKVAQTMRLTYTAEFLQLYGWGFTQQGCGRDGRLNGYKLLHVKTKNTSEVLVGLADTIHKELDTNRSLAAHCEHEAARLGPANNVGKWYATAAQMLTTAEFAIERAMSLKP